MYARISAAVVAGVMVVAPLTLVGPQAGASARPDVITVMVDDQDCSSMGSAFCAGAVSGMPKTQAWLGARGTAYRYFSTPTPSCCPSRAVYMTGQYDHNNGVRGLTQGENLNPEHTVQAALQGSGYRTFMAGKYLNAWPMDQPVPHFDDYLMVQQANYYAPLVSDNGTVEQLGPDVYSTSLITDRTVRFIDSTPKDQPLYAYVAYIAPHNGPDNVAPIPEQKYADAPVPAWHAVGEQDRSDKPPWVQKVAKSPTRIEQLYLARMRALLSVDDGMAAIRAAIQARGNASNTLITYVSDNGFLLGQHKLDEKFSPYADAVRVPAYVSWPGHLAAGHVDGRLADMRDLSATLYQATGVAPPVLGDGRSLLATWDRPWAYGEYWRDPASSFPTWRNWREIWNPRESYITWYEDGHPVWHEHYVDGSVQNTGMAGDRDTYIDTLRQCAGSSCL